MPVNSGKRTVKEIPRAKREVTYRDSTLNLPTERVGLLTTKDAARLLGLSPAMLERWRWMNAGPPFVRPTGGRAVRYRWRDLIDWIERNRVDPEEAC